MSDLIRRSDLLRILENNEPMNWRDTDEEITERACWHWFKKVVEDISPVDAVEVVRCKDCKYAMLLRKPEEKLIADCWIRKMNSEQEQFCMVSGDDFCSWGERREK